MTREIDLCMIFSDVRSIAALAGMAACVIGLAAIVWIGVNY